MKRLLLLLLVAMSSTAIYAQQCYACIGNNVNLRKGPGTNYGVIRQIWKGCGVGEGYEECDHETANYEIQYRGKKKNGFIYVEIVGEGMFDVVGWMSAKYLRPVCSHCGGYPEVYDSCDSENPKLLKRCKYCNGRGY